MTNHSSVRVRFAPSPTGYLHIGGARTALFNWLFARHHNGTFVLRIDDTDEARSTEESMRQIYDSLRWLGLDWDEGAIAGGDFGPYAQSDRREIYKKYIDQLIAENHAYKCFCTPADLDEMRRKAHAEKRPPRYDRRCLNLSETEIENFESEDRKAVIRLRIPDGATIFEDLILGEIRTESHALQDEVIVKSNGSPLYNLTSIVDDHEMEITHVIRGSDHLSNTPKQILIANALGLRVPKFAHLPMVLGSSKGEKLSKRHGATAVEQYEIDGYLPSAMINFLVRLGWSLDDTTEIFSADQLIEKFSLDRVGKSGSVFDLKKLRWLNGHYVNAMSIGDRTDAVIPFLKKDDLVDDELIREKRNWIEKIVNSVGDRLTTLADITTYSYFFFTDDFDFDPKGVKKLLTNDKVIEILSDLRNVIANVDDFEKVKSRVFDHLKDRQIKAGQAMQPLRIAITGKTVGPDLFEVVDLLGKAKVIERIDLLIQFLQNRIDD